jgi:hypothetical protein
MKRKVYATRREQMTDQILGFLAFPLVNIPLWIMLAVITYKVDASLLKLLVALPWLVNGIVLAFAFLFRPEFGMGYIGFIAVGVTLVTVLSVLFLAACFVSILSAEVIGNLAYVLFGILMLSGLAGLGVLAVNAFRSWLSSFRDNSH